MKKLNITIAIGTMAALVGALLVFAYGRSIDSRIADGKETMAVLVAVQAIEGGISSSALEESVELRDVPREYVPTGVLSDLDDVSGLVLSGPVAQDTQLTAAMFTTSEQLALLEPAEGNLAVAVQVGISPGVARYIRPGQTVDVFVTYENPPSADISVGTTKLFLSGPRVLSVSVAAATGDEEGSSQAVSGSAPQNEVIAILDVDPEEAEMLVNATHLGKLYLGLSDGSKNTTPGGVTPDDVVKANRR